jgi:hypothetical protein
MGHSHHIGQLTTADQAGFVAHPQTADQWQRNNHVLSKARL